MKYLLPLLAAILFTACTKQKKDASLPYEMPPSAPIPPENFCYVYKDSGSANITTLGLTITGDSVFGKLDFPKAENRPSGRFVGVIYGNTLVVSYLFKVDTGWQSQEQEWKLKGDTIFKMPRRYRPANPADSMQMMNHVNLPARLLKVPCANN